MANICPSHEKCPIYTGMLQGKEMTAKSYRAKYCEAGEEGRSECRRWQVKQKFGKCPENVLPNSFDSVEDIGKKFNLVENQK